MGASWGASIGVQLASAHAARVQALVLLDAGHTDVTLDRTRDELVAEFEANQADVAFDSWDAFFGYVRERMRTWRPALEPRYRAGMTERDGKIVPLASPRAAAWALHGVAAEPPSAAHASLSVPVLLVLAGDNETSTPASGSRPRCRRPRSLCSIPGTTSPRTRRTRSWISSQPGSAN